MGIKIHKYGAGTWVFHCPGCKYEHPFRVDGDATRPQWTWNGSEEKPTFTPSLMVNRDWPEMQCHLNMTDGKIHFHTDCHHDLKGQVVDCPDWEGW